MSRRKILFMAKNKKKFINAYAFLSMLPVSAFAGSGDVSVVDTLNHLVGYLTGSVGKAIATLAIVGMGYACFATGRVAKGAFVSVVVGIAIIFGAHALLGTLMTGGG